MFYSTIYYYILTIYHIVYYSIVINSTNKSARRYPAKVTLSFIIGKVSFKYSIVRLIGFKDYKFFFIGP